MCDGTTSNLEVGPRDLAVAVGIEAPQPRRDLVAQPVVHLGAVEQRLGLMEATVCGRHVRRYFLVVYWWLRRPILTYCHTAVSTRTFTLRPR